MAKVYKVVTHFSDWNLEHEVNKLIEKGWEPSGTISVDGQGRYMQPMMKEIGNEINSNNYLQEELKKEFEEKRLADIEQLKQLRIKEGISPQRVIELRNNFKNCKIRSIIFPLLFFPGFLLIGGIAYLLKSDNEEDIQLYVGLPFFV